MSIKRKKKINYESALLNVMQKCFIDEYKALKLKSNNKLLDKLFIKAVAILYDHGIGVTFKFVRKDKGNK